MQAVAAYSAFALTVGLVVTRPRFGRGLVVTPAVAGIIGVVLMMLGGVIGWSEPVEAILVLWRPLVALASIMVTTGLAERSGALETLTSRIEARAEGDPRRLFRWVFLLAAATSTVMSNDAAVLMLTPAVVASVRRRHPHEPRLLAAFAFAVFAAAGVAPLIVSNPMNLVVASFAGIDFNTYALRMMPVSIAAALTTYFTLRVLFRSALKTAPVVRPEGQVRPAGGSARAMLMIVIGSLVAYSGASWFGLSLWPVALLVALLSLLFGARRGMGSIEGLLKETISLDILIFLVAACTVALGLRNVGIVGHLAALYQDAGIGGVGALSAVGSALLNNHPMSQINMLALQHHPAAAALTLAALIGGDLGPRLLPIGSLAGLLWLEALERRRVEVSIPRFVLVGLATTIPALIVSLWMLDLVVG